MQANGVGTVDASVTPSGKLYGLYNSADTLPNNMDIMPAGTGPSNLANGGAVDPYWVQIGP